MKYTIDTNVLEQNNLTIGEFLVLWLNARNEDTISLQQSLVDKGYANKHLYDNTKLIIGDNSKELIASIIIESDKSVDNKEEWYNNVASKLRDIYPKGKKSGTSYMWRDSVAVIAKKLKTLTVKYGYTFTEEQAIKATQDYVNSFNGDYKYMQLLKYFILKSTSSNGENEIRSDFMAYIDNAGQENIESNWNDELI
jgi:hypothetical protein